MESKDDIRLLNSEQLEDFLINKNQKKYRVDQVLDWVWNKGIDSFSKMSNVSDDLKKLLDKKFVLKKPLEIKSFKSIDGTIKYSIQLSIFSEKKINTNCSTLLLVSVLGSTLNYLLLYFQHILRR